MPPHPAWVFLGGLVVIVLGAELLLRAAARIARLLGVPPILVGLTVVSVGTSMPELAVGITAATEGRGALAVGNIAGTNAFNILFILGLSAALRPLPLRLQSIRLDVPVMIATAIVLFAMAWDGRLSRADGALLMAGAVAYTAALVRLSGRESAAMRREFAEEYLPPGRMPAPGAALPPTRLGRALWNMALLAAGVAVTLLGAELLVSSAASIARSLGVSDAFIGLTVVAIGTSAPELATTIVATLKDDRDVAIGNLIGSSIYNVLVILGVTCAVSPGGIDVSRDILWIDLPLAAAVAIACYPVFKSEQQVSRREGLVFVVIYTMYLGSLLSLRH